ncbi:DMT family transporter [Ruminococcaceae bacterium OttesenSCG-928-A11]|nr:DMT family transporter [Ruminococcaceae bacterium OttesenSCG-928-A11]
MSQRVKGILAVIISAICFGLMPVFAKKVYAAGGNPFSVAFYRFAISAVPIPLYMKLAKIPFSITKRQFLDLLLISVFGYTGTALLLFSSYSFIPSGMATTIHFCYPVVVILCGMIFFKEKPSRVKVLCVALCMVGMVLFSLGDTAGSLIGVLVAFASGLTYAFYIIWLDKSSLKGMPPLKLIFYMNVVSVVLMLPIGLATGSFRTNLGTKGWAAMITMAFVVAFIAVQLFQIGVHTAGPQNASILSTFEPVTSIIAGVLFFGEALTVQVVAGCVIILVAVLLVAREKSTPPAEAPQP